MTPVSQNRRAAKRRASDAPAVRTRLTAAERRHSILSAARKVFAKNGDSTGTTIKQIAAAAGISEGVIYRHFESKDELFFAAIVEPLHAAVMSVVQANESVSPDASTEQFVEMQQAFWSSLLRTTQRILPLLGLVLFGETDRARKFYRDGWTEAVNELTRTFSEIYPNDRTYPAREIAVSSLGIAIAFALDARYNPDYDLARSTERLQRLTGPGFWPLENLPNKRRSGR